MNPITSALYKNRKPVLRVLAALFMVLLVLIVLQTMTLHQYNVLELALRDPPVGRPQDQLTTPQRLSAVRLAMAHAWGGYAKHAFGGDELKPLSQTGSGGTQLGATIIGALDTLWIMNMGDEFDQARAWVQDHFDPNADTEVGFSETSAQLLGGLLSAYKLSGDRMFLNKARLLGENLINTTNRETGLPYSVVNLNPETRRNAERKDGTSTLSDAGSVQLDLVYLATATGEKKFAEAAFRMFDTVSKGNLGSEGMLASLLDPTTGTCSGAFEMSRYFDNLLKMWIFLGGDGNPTAIEYRKSYDETVKSMHKYLFRKMTSSVTSSSQNDFTTVVSYGENGVEGKTMRADSCYAAGMLALGATVHNATRAQSPRSERDMEAARGIARACYEMHARSPVFMAPELVNVGDKFFAQKKWTSKLRFETVETLFYLWRITHDARYREWGWNIFMGMEKYSKVPGGGYSGIKDVQDGGEVVEDDLQPAWLTAGTLKYLYLLFTQDDVLPLDRFVFNANGHPYPIQEYLYLKINGED